MRGIQSSIAVHSIRYVPDQSRQQQEIGGEVVQSVINQLVEDNSLTGALIIANT